jgi:hypothetical protein
MPGELAPECGGILTDEPRNLLMATTCFAGNPRKLGQKIETIGVASD